MSEDACCMSPMLSAPVTLLPPGQGLSQLSTHPFRLNSMLSLSQSFCQSRGEMSITPFTPPKLSEPSLASTPCCPPRTITRKTKPR